MYATITTFKKFFDKKVGVSVGRFIDWTDWQLKVLEINKNEVNLKFLLALSSGTAEEILEQK
jgi:hypothetical protein